MGNKNDFSDPTGHYACGDDEDRECGTGKKQNLGVDPYKPPKSSGRDGGGDDGGNALEEELSSKTESSEDNDPKLSPIIIDPFF
jgi:hypothetical protein